MGWLMFFDGDCALCQRAARWVARPDPHGRIPFSSLPGRSARQAGLAGYADAADGSLVVMREDDGQQFIRSDAWLELAHALGGWWRVGGLLRLRSQRPARGGFRRGGGHPP